MIRLRSIVALALGVVAISGCRRDAKIEEARAAELKRRAESLAERLASSPASDTAPLAKWILPPELREISGLALTSNGRLLTHNDEQARVYVIDPRSGEVLQQFNVGESPLRADFEGIAVAPDGKILMLTSNGDLYRFEEGAEGSRVQYTKFDPGLGKECEFEGVAFDRDSAWVVMPCKNANEKSLRDQLVIYRWRIDGGQPPVMMTVPLAFITAGEGPKGLHPSDITIDPTTGNYIIIAAQEKLLIELTRTGEIVRTVPLPGNPAQAEGVAITTDNILILSDEARKTPASITLWRWPIGTSVKDTLTRDTTNTQ